MAKKLYEVLVVEGQLKTQAVQLRAELRQTFEKKRHLFEERRKTFTPIEEGAPAVVEEQSDIQTNVLSELRWLAGLWTRALDTSFAVAEGNMHARADVVLDDGTVLLTSVPATALMELEKRVTELQEVLTSAPTLDPAKGFVLDPDRGKHIFKAREVVKTRGRKVQKVITLAEATPEHPAQAQLISVDEPAGRLQEQEWSGLITPAHKSELLARAETLRRALKQALHRANDVELPTVTPIGQTLFTYVLGAE